MTQEELGSLIRRAIKGSQNTQKGVAKRLDVSPNTMTSYVQGKSAPDAIALLEIAKLCDLPIGYFYGESENSVGIPVVGEVPAGSLVERYVVDHPDEFVPLDESRIARSGERLFGLRVPSGSDSMAPYILPHDVVVCSPVQSVSVGDDVAVYVQATGQSTVKRLTTLNTRQRYVQLTPLNAEYSPFRLDLAEGDQIFKVLLIVRDATRRRSKRP